MVYRSRLESMIVWKMQNPAENVTALMNCCNNRLRKAPSLDQVQQFSCVGVRVLIIEVTYDQQTSFQGITQLKEVLETVHQKICFSCWVEGGTNRTAWCGRVMDGQVVGGTSRTD